MAGGRIHGLFCSAWSFISMIPTRLCYLVFCFKKKNKLYWSNEIADLLRQSYEYIFPLAWVLLPPRHRPVVALCIKRVSSGGSAVTINRLRKCIKPVAEERSSCGRRLLLHYKIGYGLPCNRNQDEENRTKILCVCSLCNWRRHRWVIKVCKCTK
jgi:hypothetical protein